jgi:hypothetical protein
MGCGRRLRSAVERSGGWGEERWRRSMGEGRGAAVGESSSGSARCLHGEKKEKKEEIRLRWARRNV